MSSPTEFIAEPEAVMLDLQVASGEDAVRALHERLAAVSEGVVDAPHFLSEVIERMKLGPVCIADNVALPHARTDAVSRLVFAVARAAKPIAFDAEHPQVRLVFLIGTPKSAVTQYLQVVAALSRRLRSGGTCAALLAAADETEFRALLAGGLAARR